MLRPHVAYAPTSDGQKIGYTMTGTGPLTVVMAPSFVADAEGLFGEATIVRFLAGLSSGRRLLIMDRRGTGLSDRPNTTDALKVDRVSDDIESVLNHAGAHRAVLLARGWGGPGALRFAASRPHRTAGLALVGTCAKNSPGDGYELGSSQAALRLGLCLGETWGTVVSSQPEAPSVAHNERFLGWMAWQERQSFPPGSVAGLLGALAAHDARTDLARIQTPTLVVQRRDDPVWDPGHSRYLATNIKGAQLRLLPGHDHLLFAPGQADMLRVLNAFLDVLTPRTPPPAESQLGLDATPLPSWTALTETELEVARLVALGLSNKQIAHRRSISPNTVDTHLRRIYRKMQVPNRAALAHRMATQHLT